MLANSEQKSFSTRFQGCKKRILPWIFDKIGNLNYETVLDAFNGSASVAYEFKRRGKEVTCNDILKSCYFSALGLIENSHELLSDKEISYVTTYQKGKAYPNFVQETFRGIYYTEEENRWIDMAITNIQELSDMYKKALALHALFQSCLIKRPFNLFHRRNLSLRLANVKRTFHNHKTWKRSFTTYFKKFALEANASIFSNGKENRAWNFDVLSIPEESFDLVYIDPPYVAPNGKSVDYQRYYHFLEGLCDYEHWPEKINYDSCNLRLKDKQNNWGKKETVERSFRELFEKFCDSILIVSYRSPSFPSKTTLKELLEQYKTEVQVFTLSRKYALSKRSNSEILLIGE